MKATILIAAALLSIQCRRAKPDSAKFVAGAYIAVLGRDVDAAGLSYWKEQMDSGVPGRTVCIHLLASPEYSSKFSYPASQSYITTLFTLAYKRQPTPDENTHWLNELNAPPPAGQPAQFYARAAMAETLINQPEFARVQGGRLAKAIGQVAR